MTPACSFSDTDRAAAHRFFSAHCFNETWASMKNLVPDAGAEDILQMVSLAHASYWHWTNREDCKPENLSIAYWLLSRTWAVAGNGKLARNYGRLCRNIGKEQELGCFYRGYAWEALARAALIDGKREHAAAAIKKASLFLEEVTDEKEREYLSHDIEELRGLFNGCSI